MSVVAAFTDEKVSKLTGLSKSQLRSWDKEGFIAPSLAEDNRRLAYSRVYSFRDVVALRVIASLKNDHSVSTQHLKQVAKQLAHLGEDLWTSTTLYVLNKKVVIYNPEVDSLQEVIGGQGVFKIPLKVAMRDTEADVAELFKRDQSTIGKVSSSRYVMNGEEVVAGTRIPVRSVVSYLEMGLPVARILSDYPDLTLADVELVKKSWDKTAA